MDSKYHLLTPGEKEDYMTRTDSTGDSYEQHDLDALLSLKRRTNKWFDFERPAPKWLWMLHAVLLTSSITLLTLSIMIRSSTLKHVQEFSAWCEHQTLTQGLLRI